MVHLCTCECLLLRGDYLYLNCTFFFNDTATTEIYTYLHTLALHDALPILPPSINRAKSLADADEWAMAIKCSVTAEVPVLVYAKRSEEHTSELQSLMRISYAVLCWKKKID